MQKEISDVKSDVIVVLLSFLLYLKLEYLTLL